MAKVIVVGAGLNGLTTGLLLQADGHDVTVVDRDGGPVPVSAEDAWRGWERRGVNQFRLPHLMLARWRQEMGRELPEVIDEVLALGGRVANSITGLPLVRREGARPDDKIYDCIAARRPVVELALARVAARAGLEVRRGVAVAALRARSGPGAVPHVSGIVTDAGECLTGDLVIDAAGRRSSLPALLTAIGARPPIEEIEDSGFVYYGRHLRAPDGELPEMRAPVAQLYESVTILTLPADNGTWGVVVAGAARDKALRPLRHPEVWNEVVARYPAAAEWAAGEPLGGVDVMSAIPDRYRRLVVDDEPVATGVIAVGDSWGCTNPSLGRGTSIGVLHAQAIRDVLHDVGTDDPEKLVRRADEVTEQRVAPWYRATVAFDRARLAQIDAEIDGTEAPTDPAFAIASAMRSVASVDVDVLRAFHRIAGVLALPEEVVATPGLFDKVLALAPDVPRYPYEGLTRAELLGTLSSIAA